MLQRSQNCDYTISEDILEEGHDCPFSVICLWKDERTRTVEDLKLRLENGDEERIFNADLVIHFVLLSG
jgi:hypothetical protein